MRAATRAGRNRHRSLLVASSAAALGATLLLPGAAGAVDVHWVSPDGNWSDASQWSPAQVPTSADVAFVDNATAGSTAHVNSAVPSAGRIDLKAGNIISVEPGGTVGSTGDSNLGVTSAGAVHQTGGSFNVGAWGFVGKDGGTGVYTQSAGTFAVAGQTYVGFNGGTGSTYNLSGGTLQSGSDFAVGVRGATATMNQTGGTVNAGWTFVGKRHENTGAGGTGDYNLDSGNLNVFGTMSVGFQAGSSGTFDQIGGDVVVTKVGTDANSGHLNVGIDGGSAIYTQSGGTTRSHWGFVGRGGGGNGTYNQIGGTYSTRGWLRISEGANSTGRYNLSGNGVLNVGGGDADTGDDDLVVGIDGGNGALSVQQNATVNVARDIRVGANGATGSVTQTGGVVTVNGQLFLAQGATSTGTYFLGNGTLDLTGGDIVPGGGNASFIMGGGRLEDADVINLRLDQTGGVLAPGGGVGTTTIVGTGSVGYLQSSGATLEIDIATSSSSDSLRIDNGSADLSGKLDIIAAPGLSFFDVFTVLDVTDPTMSVVGQFTGKPDGSTFFEDGYLWEIDYDSGPDNNNVTLTVVPEPAAVGMVGFALIGLVARRRQRRT